MHSSILKYLAQQGCETNRWCLVYSESAPIGRPTIVHIGLYRNRVRTRRRQRRKERINLRDYHRWWPLKNEFVGYPCFQSLDIHGETNKWIGPIAIQ